MDMARKFEVGSLNKNALVTADAMAAIVGCHVTAVKKWLKAGNAKYVKVGRAWVIDLSSIKW